MSRGTWKKRITKEKRIRELYEKMTNVAVQILKSHEENEK